MTVASTRIGSSIVFAPDPCRVRVMGRTQVNYQGRVYEEFEAVEVPAGQAFEWFRMGVATHDSGPVLKDGRLLETV